MSIYESVLDLKTGFQYSARLFTGLTRQMLQIKPQARSAEAAAANAAARRAARAISANTGELWF